MPNIAQIQIQPVDNGFVVQAVNIDGENFSRKLVAVDKESLRLAIHELADQLYVARPKKEKPPTEPAS
jgi:hypothetical protein